MRRIQISARGGRECNLHSALEKTYDPVAAGIISVTVAIAVKALIFC